MAKRGNKNFLIIIASFVIIGLFLVINFSVNGSPTGAFSILEFFGIQKETTIAKDITPETTSSENSEEQKRIEEDLKEMGVEEFLKFDGYLVILSEKPTYKHVTDLKSSLGQQEQNSVFGNNPNLKISGTLSTTLLNEYNIQRQRIEQQQTNFIQNNPKIEVRDSHYKLINALLIDAPPRIIEDVKEQPGVERIWPNIEVKTQLQESIPLINADDVWNLGYTGQGIKIAIIDTGVDYLHDDLGGCFGSGCKVTNGYDFTNNDNDPMDDHGHGTHVAATAAGNGNPTQGGLIGVAPDAEIYAVKVLGSGGSGSTNDVISGIEWSVDPDNDPATNDGADIISLSLGSAGDPNDAKSIVIDNAVNTGVIATAAAGNSGPGSFTTISPGTARKAITVGASDKNDVLADFSSRGPTRIWTVKPDVTAPGVEICAAQWDNWLEGQRECNPELDKHIAIGGTSMATPHVAGAAALIKNAHPTWTPDEVKYALRNTAIDIGYNALEQGHGRIDILEAINVQDPIISLINPATQDYKKGGVIPFDISIQSQQAIIDAYEINLINVQSGSTKQLHNVDILTPTDPTNIVMDTKDVDMTFEEENQEFLVELIAKPTTTTHKESKDYFYLKVDNIRIETPKDGDVLHRGGVIDITGESYLPIAKIEYQEYPNTAWLSQGITLTGNQNGLLAQWDTSTLTKNDYTLRIETVAGTHESLKVYLDPTLKEGWPVRIPWSHEPLSNSYLEAGPLTTTPFDINNDGKQEIIVSSMRYFESGDTPSKIHVFNTDGTDFPGWPIEITDYAITLSPPTIADLNPSQNDGYEILVMGSLYDQYGWPSINDPVELFIFKQDGSNYIAPITLDKLKQRSWFPDLHPVVSDLNLDRIPEIIIWNNDAKDSMYVLDNQGNPLPGWPKFISSDIHRNDIGPVIGNFDNDDELEVILVYSEKILSVDKMFVKVFEFDGSERILYQEDNTLIVFDGDAVIGDLDNDGQEELIIMAGANQFDKSIYLIRKDGSKIVLFSGIALANGKQIISNVDNDKELEIITRDYELGFETKIINHDGTELNNFFFSLSETTSVDINNDNIAEIFGGVVASNPSIFNKNLNEIKGVRSDNTNLPGFPKYSESNAGSNFVITDLNNDCTIQMVGSSDLDYSSNGYPERKNRGSIYVWELGNGNAYNKPDWPMMGHDAQRTGRHIKQLGILASRCLSPNLEPIYSCEDSDGGIVYQTKGTVVEVSRQGKQSFTDKCVPNPQNPRDPPVLEEWYCDGLAAKSQIYDCTRGIIPEICEDGRCKPI